MTNGIQTVAVIGAGVSGITSAAHLISEGLQVTVFERASVPGGVWVYDKRIPLEPAYPSVKASTAEFAFHDSNQDVDQQVIHSPPGPCYEGLKNNVPTELLELSLNQWKPNTPPFTTHDKILEYLQDTVIKAGIEKNVVYNTRVEELFKEHRQDKWIIRSTTWDSPQQEKAVKTWTFDAVVIASGHYHAPNVPDIPGLAEWKTAWPSRITHSKLYRNPKSFGDQETVLLIGGSTSSTDIAKELGPKVKKIWQSTRNGPFDHPASELPENATRVAQIASFGPLVNKKQTNGPGEEIPAAIPGKVALVDGEVLDNIDRVIVCTGYHFSLPFLPAQYHHDDLPADQADEVVLVTDGTMIHNLHRDIFYIPDPTLAFVGVPFRVATFSFFEFQAIAVAAVFSGHAVLPSQAVMRSDYKSKLTEKGLGKPFHAMMGTSVKYVAELMGWINQGRDISQIKTRGYSPEWIETQADYIAKLEKYKTTHKTQSS